MRKTLFFAVLVVMLASFATVQAQQFIPMSDVDPYITHQLEVQQFPTTGAQIEAIRQEISQGIANEIGNVVESIGELDGVNQVGRAWLGEVEEAASANTPQTARQQWDDYRQRSTTNSEGDDRPVLPQQPEGIDGEINDVITRVGDSVRDIFRSEAGELPQYQYTGQRPATGMQALAERYGREVNRLNAQFAWDEQRRREFAEAVADGASSYIDERIERYRNITKRMVRRFVQMMTASQELPISGYWRIEGEVEYARSGNCASYYCDGCGGGVIPQPEEEDPGEPLCGYDAAPPFLFWRGMEHPYLQGTSNIYSAATQVEIQIARNGNGATLGNLRTEHTLEYEVVAPDRIVVRDVFREIGGCSFSAEYVLVLVRPDETVCNITELPDFSATPEPVVTPPPGESRPFRVGQPFYTDETQCDATTTPPTLDEITLTAQTDGSMRVEYAEGEITLYQQGQNYYEFNTGTGVALRQIVSLVLFEDGASGNLSWSNVDTASGKNCYASLDVTLPGAEPAPISTPAPDVADDPSQDNGVSQPASALSTGRYVAEWIELPGLCHADLEPVAPQFSEAIITVVDALTVTMDFNGETLTLENGAEGMFFALTMTSALNASTSLIVDSAESASFSWAGGDTADSSKTCVVMATLTRVE
jgi:hypothetical protein